MNPDLKLPFSSRDLLAPGLALIFDMDGVLIDSNPAHREAWIAYNRGFGLETTGAMLERMYGKRNDEIVRDFFGDGLSEAEVARRGAAKECLYREMIAGRVEQMLAPGLRQFLETYRESPMALASNAEPENVEFLLDRAGLREYFRVILDGHKVTRPKPDPEVYLLAAHMLGVSPANCIVFEDSHSGATAARRAGARVVGVNAIHESLLEAAVCVDNFLNGVLGPWLQSQRPISLSS